MTSCRGIAVIRVEDRLLLVQKQHPEASIDPTAWSDAVSKCSALGSKVIDRIAYSIKADEVTVYAVVNKKDGLGTIAFMSENVAQRVGYLCCEKTLETFSKMFLERTSALSPSICATFERQLGDLMTQFNDANVVDDRIVKVKRAVEDVKSIALENVERVIDRGEKIDTMVEATRQLEMDAEGFHTNAASLRRQLWWNAMRVRLLGAGIVAAFVFVVYLTYCGGLSCSSS